MKIEPSQRRTLYNLLIDLSVEAKITMEQLETTDSLEDLCKGLLAIKKADKKLQVAWFEIYQANSPVRYEKIHSGDWKASQD